MDAVLFLCYTKHHKRKAYMMDDSYDEILVKRKPSGFEPLIRIVIIAVMALFVIAAIVFFNPYFLIGALAMIVAAFIVFPRLKVEYEYLYVNGDFDVDEIFDQSKRKRIRSFNLEGVELVALQSSHRLDPYASYKVVDFSARDPQDPPYVIVKGANGAQEKILMQLNEQVLTDLKRKMPRKVYEND